MEEPDILEKRRLARWRTSFFFRKDDRFERKFFDVIDEEKGKSIGHLVDLNLEGLRIIGRTNITREAIHSLKIVLPKEVEGVQQIFVKAQCVWCEKDTDPEFYLAGFRILSISPPFSEIVDTLVQM